MKKILSTFDNASTGKVTGVATANKNEMKTILESFSKVAECGMDMPPMPAPQDMGNPVTVNVSLNASGKEHVKDLLDLLKMAGISNPSMPMDEPKLAIDMDGDNQPDIALDDPTEEFENEPEEEYQDSKFMTKDISGGLNREKKQYAKAQDGDNAMAVESIKSRLMQALSEKKAKPDFLDMDKDGNKKEPMKKAIADKKKNPFAKKEAVEEGWDDMLKAVKDKSKPQPNGGAGKKQGTRYGGGKQKDEPEATDKKKK